MRTKFILPPVVKRPMLAAYGITILMTLIVSAYIFISQPQLPIFYSLAQPEQQIANRYWLFIVPILSLLFNILHLVVIHFMRKYENLILQLFAWTTFSLQTVLLIAVLRIVYITI